MENNLITKLKERLEKPLPGNKAHQEMAAKTLNGDRVSFQMQPNPRQSAVMVLLYEVHGSVYFPLIQRPAYIGVHGGQIALPGGKTEPEDISLVDTALRETHEEIGIDSAHIQVVGQLTEFYVGASNYLVQPVIGFLSTSPKFKAEQSEVAEILEASVDRLVHSDTVKEAIINVRGFDIKAPYFDLNDKMVWGATAMILNEFVTIMREI